MYENRSWIRGCRNWKTGLKLPHKQTNSLMSNYSYTVPFQPLTCVTFSTYRYFIVGILLSSLLPKLCCRESWFPKLFLLPRPPPKLCSNNGRSHESTTDGRVLAEMKWPPSADYLTKMFAHTVQFPGRPRRTGRFAPVASLVSIPRHEPKTQVAACSEELTTSNLLTISFYATAVDDLYILRPCVKTP
jgi:hypothetical protein